MPKICVGRDDEDQEEHGLDGTGMIGKHLVGEGPEAHTANPVYMDLARPHVMGIFGKRGTGKSYSMGTIAEELYDSDISDNLSTVIIDSMGVYWSMKRPNDRGAGILDKWGFKPQAYDTTIYIPAGKTEEFTKKEIPYDETFTINPGELTSEEWRMALNIDNDSEMSILLDKTISKLKDTAGNDYRLHIF